MNFLKSTIETLTGTSIPYSLDEKLVGDVTADPMRSKSIWNVYSGTSTKDGAKVTVFEFDLKNPAMAKHVQQAKNAAKRIRSLSLLPGVLTVVDTIENENNIYIVTERVRPLDDVLTLDYPEEQFPEDLIVLGIYQVAQAIKFVNKEGGSVHCNVCTESIFVTESGEWKLGGFELLINETERNFGILSTAYQLPTFRASLCPPEFKDGAQFFEKAKPQYAVKFDGYKYGVFVYQLLNAGTVVSSPQDLGDMSQVPRNMVPHLKKLLNPSVSVRYSVEQFLKFGENSYFETPLIDLWQSLSELALKDRAEKLELFQSLDEISQLPRGLFENRVLPDLIGTFQTLDSNEDNVKSMLLYIILKNSALADDEMFNKMIKPVIFQAFTLPDRAIRMTLLNALPQLADKFSNYEVQDKVFPNLVQGFNDTNASIREETIKAVLPIVSKISDRQMNNDLLRYLARLQGDESSEIRTNVIVCLSKMAEFMNSNSRTGVLITAFGKALKDSFVPARLSTVEAFKTCIDYFSPEVCCSRVLSALAPALLDKSSAVRDEAESAMELYMEKIRQEAAKLPRDDAQTVRDEQAKSDSLAQGLNSLSLNNVGRLFGGFGAGTGAPDNGSTASLTMKTRELTPEQPSRPAQPSAKKSSFLDEDDIDLEDDGWGNFDDEPVAKPAPRKTVPAPRPKPASRTAKKGLSLKPKTKSKLQLEIEADDDDDGDGWGDEW